MKNKYFILSMFVVFGIIWLLLLSEQLTTIPLYDLVRSNVWWIIIYLVIWDLITISLVNDFLNITLKWDKRKEINYVPEESLNIISVFVTIGFNMLGLLYYAISNAPLVDSLLILTFNGFLLIFLFYVIFKVLLYLFYNTTRTNSKK